MHFGLEPSGNARDAELGRSAARMRRSHAQVSLPAQLASICCPIAVTKLTTARKPRQKHRISSKNQYELLFFVENMKELTEAHFRLARKITGSEFDERTKADL